MFQLRAVTVSTVASMALLQSGQAALAAPMVVSQCGTVVAAMQTAVLAANVDCTGHVGPGITLQDGAMLQLGGFSLIGDPAQPATDGVVCETSCRVAGPGEIRGFTRDGVKAASSIMLDDVDIRGQGEDGADANFVTAKDCGFYDNAGTAMNVSKLADAGNCTFTGNGTAMEAFDRDDPDIYVGRIRAHGCTITDNLGGLVSIAGLAVVDTTITGNGFGVSGTRVTITSSQITDNGSGVDAEGMPHPSITITDSTISRNDSDGVYTDWSDPFVNFPMPFGTVRVVNSDISDNAGYGIWARKSASVSDSTIDGNRDGVFSLRVRVSRSSVSQNTRRGIIAAPRNRGGLFRFLSARVKVQESTVTDNGCDGVRGYHSSLSSPPAYTGVNVQASIVTGNALSVEFAAGECDADITTEIQPIVVGTTCNTSHSDVSGTDWDKCALDPM